MKNKLVKALTLLGIVAVIAVTVIFVPGQKRVDFGDFSGGGDYGGGDSYSGGDYDSGDSWSSGDTYYSSGGSSSSSGSITPFIVFAVIVILIVVFGKRKGASTSSGRKPAGAAWTTGLTPIAEYKVLDSKFDEGAFRERIGNLYVQMQNGWQAKDLSPLRPYFTDAFFTQMERQLQENYIAKNRTNIIENIAVLDVELRGFTRDASYDHMFVKVYARITDYVIDDKTKEVINGSQTASKFMTYEWEMSRSIQAATPAGANGTASADGTVSSDGSGLGSTVTQADGTTTTANTNRVSCPSCGAPLDINASARCPYCGAVVFSDNFNWAIVRIKGISQETR